MTQFRLLKLAIGAFVQLKHYISVAQAEGVEKGLIAFIKAYRSNTRVRAAANPYLFTGTQMAVVWSITLWGG